mmetsp:Transcript_132383/g.300925  ORF Transcript_132383/g.300925 Transcript_132383/m.300925 type:complete len:205 (-) Transcript_132383:86-700(-)
MSAAVSWKTARLTWDDIGLLEPGRWLNDAVIGFWTEYNSAAMGDAVCVMDPAAGFWVAVEEDMEDLQDGLQPLDLQDKQIVLVPVNDRSERGSEGGCHWSLLELRRGEAGITGHYYDSIGVGNLSQAQKLANKVVSFMETKQQRCEVKVEACGKQSNSSDCGVFALLFIETLLSGGDTAAVTPGDASAMRQRMKQVVMSLAKPR